VIRALALAAAVLAAGAAASSFATGPDPAARAQADGCTRKTTELFTQQVPTWVYVDDEDYPASGSPPPPQSARGVISSGGSPAFFGVHPTPVDDPPTHDSYDVILNLLPAPESAGLLGGDPATRTGNFEGEDEETGRLHMELEENAFPAFAWPETGNRVQVVGSWIWDCGHWLPGGERTEFHPFRVLWVDRGVSPRSPYGETEGDLFVTTDKTQAGKQSDCAHKAKGDSAVFRACLAVEPNWQSVNGVYRFALRAPAKPTPGAKLRVRVVDGGSTPAAPVVRVTPTGSGVAVALDVQAPAGKRVVVAKKIFVGWSPMPARALPEHLRLAFEQLLVRRAMDPGCPSTQPGCSSVETTRGSQITFAPGEWTLYGDVAGIWSRWRPAILRVRDGQTVKLSQTVDVYVRGGASWRVLVFGRECDFGALSAGNPTRPPAPCPRTAELGDLAGDDSPGTVVDRYLSPAAGLGRHSSNAKLEASTCPPVNRTGCFRVTYRVGLLKDAAARAARLAGRVAVSSG
jgi:hypothetical protein